MKKIMYDPSISYQENLAQGPQYRHKKSNVWKADRPPHFSFLGFPVDSLFGIPAGPLLNAAYVQAAFDEGFSICTYKTVRSNEYPCHPFPNVVPVHVKQPLSLQQAQDGLTVSQSYKEPLTITNSFGVPSQSPVIWQQELQQLMSTLRKGQLLIGSFQGTVTGGSDTAFIDDCVRTASMVAETGVPVMEINLSCPNEGSGHLLCFDIERSYQVISAIKKQISTPLIIKIAYFSDDDQLKKFVTKVGPVVEGIAAINTIPSKIVTESGEQALPGKGRAISGVCGDAIRRFGLEMVGRLSELRAKLQLPYTIVGVGGVMNAHHFHEYRNAGADAVMSATGAMWNPDLGKEIYEFQRNN